MTNPPSELAVAERVLHAGCVRADGAMDTRRENVEGFSTQALQWDDAPRREILPVTCGAEQAGSGGRASEKSAG